MISRVFSVSLLDYYSFLSETEFRKYGTYFFFLNISGVALLLNGLRSLRHVIYDVISRVFSVSLKNYYSFLSETEFRKCIIHIFFHNISGVALLLNGLRSLRHVVYDVMSDVLTYIDFNTSDLILPKLELRYFV